MFEKSMLSHWFKCYILCSMCLHLRFNIWVGEIIKVVGAFSTPEKPVFSFKHGFLSFHVYLFKFLSLQTILPQKMNKKLEMVNFKIIFCL